MESELVAGLIGVTAGAFGYCVTTFWMQPILRYRDVRSRVLIDLVFFAQVTSAEGLRERMQKLYKQRVESNRRRSVEVRACILQLPEWYKLLVKMQGRNPQRASADLIGFSNTSEYDAAAMRIEGIKKDLGFDLEDV